MPMWIELHCNECNDFLDGYYYNSKAPAKLRKRAKEVGWKKIGKDDAYLCPECQAKLKELEGVKE